MASSTANSATLGPPITARRALGLFSCSLFLFPLLIWASLTPAIAELRKFTNSAGQEIIAEIVSAKGDLVNLRKDGKVITARINVFGKEDQDYIRRWIQENPPKIDYHFDIQVDKKKLDRSRQDMGYKKASSDTWAYRITVTNRSRETIDECQLKYRAFKRDVVDGSYLRGSFETVMKEGSVALPEMKYNHTAAFTTESFQLEMVHYDYTTKRTEDELEGVIIRIVDPDGDIISEHREGPVSIKSRSWDDTKPGAGGKKAVIVNPLGNN